MKGANKMSLKKFNVMWKEIQEVSVIIAAESKEEAEKKWENGDYNDKDVDIDDKDVVFENGEYLVIEEMKEEE
jgi:hypothetical protein